MHNKSLNEPCKFWGDIAEEFYWEKPFDRRNVYSHNFDKTKGPVNVKWFEGKFIRNIL